MYLFIVVNYTTVNIAYFDCLNVYYPSMQLNLMLSARQCRIYGFKSINHTRVLQSLMLRLYHVDHRLNVQTVVVRPVSISTCHIFSACSLRLFCPVPTRHTIRPPSSRQPSPSGAAPPKGST